MRGGEDEPPAALFHALFQTWLTSHARTQLGTGAATAEISVDIIRERPCASHYETREPLPAIEYQMIFSRRVFLPLSASAHAAAASHLLLLRHFL